ncbi:phospholipid-transporting ATPase ID isoform X1 [Folsomia candida]|uniref:phospholipid-transporting ATPase ID isoform X1 n=1 Tax=Folsomia candida TaxID=158441 RepID=UPI001604AC41|nr:phospholipid-transporting ATPase ID isoform X1 [Folsomia candida]
MPKTSNVIEVFQIKGSSGKGTRHVPPHHPHPNDSSIPGVKTKLLVRKAGKEKGFFSSSSSSPMGSKLGRKYGNAIILEEESGSGGNIGGADSFLMATTSSTPIRPSGSSSSCSSFIPCQNSPATQTESVIKLTTKVTTMEEIIKSQSSTQLLELDRVESTDGTDLESSNINVASCLHDNVNERSDHVAVLDKRKDTKFAKSRPRGVILREPDIDEMDEEDHANYVNESPITGHHDDEDGSDLDGRTCSGCCRWCSFDKCCRVYNKPRRSYRQETSLSSGASVRWRGPCERLTPYLPSRILSLLGFISKIYWRIIDGALGLEPPYRGHGGGEETERRIRANDPAFNSKFSYANNYIKTTKYTVITFLPLNLFEQFQRLANFYFLCLLVLQMIPVISSLTPYTTVFPLLLVLTLTATKDAYDDWQRHLNDSQVNNRKSLVLRNGLLKEERWHKVIVGDVIRMENDQFVAADVLLLSTSEPNGLCYIETAELDGETNLKCRQCLTETADMGQEPEKLGSFNGEIICEPPNNHLNKFEGALEWKGKRFPLDNDKVLLRGCILRNTQWCYGVVLFAGRDTKLMQNSGKSKFKRTSIDRLLNFIILGIVFFLLSMCLFCTIACAVWETMIGQYFINFLPWDSLVPKEPVEGAIIISLLVFFSYAIILNTVVPISLYVSVEVIRLMQSLLINWDLKMYHEASGTPAKARTTTLNEELGQIEYIFTDKTGTLTQNIMTFNKCTIGGKSYGEVIDPRTGEVIEHGETEEIFKEAEPGVKYKDYVPSRFKPSSLFCGSDRVGTPTPESEHLNHSDIALRQVTKHNLAPVDFSRNPHFEQKFRFYDQSLYDAVLAGNPDVSIFFRHLALCHTVMADERAGVLEYQAQSPDENALVSAARNFEFVFKERSPDSITISVMGKEEVYDLLCILDFNNVRKRMSVVVQREGKIMLLCKGADSVIFERLEMGRTSEDLRAKTQEHLNKFAGEGLRTLVLAVKELTPAYFEDWKARHYESSMSLTNRDEKLDEIYEEMETGMHLIGATAIEDKLQDGVPQTIANLALAGIKIWVLTGDKQETAINIGYSCQLLTDEMNDIFIVDAYSFDDVKGQLLKFLDALQKGSCAMFDNSVTKSNDVSMVTFRDSDMGHPGDDPTQDTGGYAVVINGHSLVHALNPQLEQLFLELASQCRAVICCRVTPLQKALVVELVKNYKKAVTLAIGDGANDVSMIKTAHIGVGISGQEGLQAVLASDYSIAQFRYLERLLLVHGRWSYYRMAKFLRYFFYKNFAFTLTHFWFAFFCGFSAQTVFDPMFIAVYNLFYTSLPVLSIGIFDQDCNDDYCIRYPKLYTPGHLNLLFNKKEFFKSALHGFVTSCVIFLVPYGTYHHAISADGQGLSDHMLFGSAVSTILVVITTVQVALDTAYWTVFNHIAIWGTILFYFILHYIYNFAIRGRYLGSLTKALQEASFWFTLVLTVMILIIPVLAWRFYFHDVHPTLSDRVRLKQRVSSAKTRQAQDKAFRTPSARRSRRSLRSSYAFAHQEGFGPLITSGKIMRKAKSNNNHTAGSTVASLVSSVTSFGATTAVLPPLAKTPRITMVSPQQEPDSSVSVRL